MPGLPSFHSAHTFDVAFDSLAESAMALGFDAVDYGVMPRALTPSGGFHAPRIEVRNFPVHWRRGWKRFSCIDPFLYGCYPRTLPLDWGEVRGASWLTENQRDAISYIESLGFKDGVTVPIHMPMGGFAFVSALSRETGGAWRNQAALVENRLFLLAHRFHSLVTTHDRGCDRDSYLSRRQREVLIHAAAGLSAPETAALMCRSIETVRRQRKTAMARLGAHTIAQAVARALGSGIIGYPGTVVFNRFPRQPSDSDD